MPLYDEALVYVRATMLQKFNLHCISVWKKKGKEKVGLRIAHIKKTLT